MNLDKYYAAYVLDAINELFLDSFEFDLDKYFNAGFLLSILKIMARDNVELLFINFMKDNQDIINMIRVSLIMYLKIK